MSDKLKLVNIDDKNYINPKYVVRVYQFGDGAVDVDVCNGDLLIEIKSKYSLEGTIKLLTE